MHAVIMQAVLPTIMALNTSLARFFPWLGAKGVSPPSWTPIEPKLENPLSAYDAM